MPEPEESATEDLNPTEPETPTVDTSLYEAKIAELNSQIIALNEVNAALTLEIQAQKAANYDLLIAGGDTDDNTDIDTDDETDDIDDADVSIDDILYEKEN